MNMRRVSFLWLIGRMACALQVPVNSPPDVTFRTGVKLVQVSVIAEDKHGKPVGDLRREDFKILDNGSPRDIRLFVAKSENSNITPPPRPPNIFTNEATRPASSRSGFSVILIDSIFTDFGDPFDQPGSANARLYALRALQSIPLGERVAVYVTARKFQTVCEFTSDRDLLERQLKHWRPRIDTPDVVNMRDFLHSSNRGGLAAEEDPAIQFPLMDALQRASSSNHEMDQVAEHLAGIPGRKNLIWLSTQFVIGPQALRKFNEANVGIYPVNIRGVMSTLDPLKYRLKGIAALTGGVAYSMRNDIDVAIREAMEDGRVSYTLGFYQSEEDDPLETHRLAVRVSRPGVVLRYRATYRAEAPPPHSINAVAELVQALNRPIDATGIRIQASVTRDRDRLKLKAVVDVASLELAPIEDRWRGKIEFAARFTAAEGTPVGEVSSQTLSLNLRREQQGVGYNNELTIPSEAVELKLLFANLTSGKIGTLTIPLSKVAAREPNAN
jgi:VWFA-related protein